MNRPWLTWTVFGACLLLALSALVWVSCNVLRLDHAEAEGRRQAALEESVRLSLWRMDSELAALVAQESSRPYFAYSSFYPAERAYNQMFCELNRGEVLIPSPVLTEMPENVRMHFQFSTEGPAAATSPQVPVGKVRTLAKDKFVTPEQLAEGDKRLNDFNKFATCQALLAKLPEESAPEPVLTARLNLDNENPRYTKGGYSKETQQEANWAEYQARNAVQQKASSMNSNQQMYGVPQGNAAKQNRRVPSGQSPSNGPQNGNDGQQNGNDAQAALNQAEPDKQQAAPEKQQQAAPQQEEKLSPQEKLQQEIVPQNDGQALNAAPQADSVPPGELPRFQFPNNDANGAPGTASVVYEGALHPVWLGNELVLARRVTVDGKVYVQGCWLDWTAIRDGLLAKVHADLLPNAELVPMQAPRSTEDRMLAALPVKLIPGLVPALDDAGWSPLRWSLVVAWACVLLAGAAVGVLLFGALSLSERRGAFVGAVTHELRTPLTTFRMYTEMLTGGMVSDEAQRKQYYATLHAEAERLGHLVENVLAYARLEKNSVAGRLETLSAAALLEKASARMKERLTQVGLELVMPDAQAQAALEASVRADPGAVEQVLFNLADNAAKYAVKAEDKRVQVDVNTAGRSVEISVSDHGPGIGAAMRRKLFQPFSKSAQEAAVTAPGVGLGLALCRRLARQMGGELSYAPGEAGGARFTLSLPKAG